MAARRGPRCRGGRRGRRGRRGRPAQLRRRRHGRGRPRAAQRPGARGRVPRERAGRARAGRSDRLPAAERARRLRRPRPRARERALRGRRGGGAGRRDHDRGRQHVRERPLPAFHHAGRRRVRALGRPRQRAPPVRRLPHAAHGGEPDRDDRRAPRPDRPHPDRRLPGPRRAGHGRDRLRLPAGADRGARLRRLGRPGVQAHPRHRGETTLDWMVRCDDRLHRPGRHGRADGAQPGGAGHDVSSSTTARRRTSRARSTAATVAEVAERRRRDHHDAARLGRRARRVADDDRRRRARSLWIDMSHDPPDGRRSSSPSAASPTLDAPVSGGDVGAQRGHAVDHGRRRRRGLRARAPALSRRSARRSCTSAAPAPGRS